MTPVRKGLGTGLLLALVSCNSSPTRTADAPEGEHCLDLPVYPPSGVTDLKQTVFACVERTAAMYAKGPDTPQAISDAVVVKCQEPIMHYVEKRAKDASEQPQYNAVIEAWRKHALPVIAEARARHCYS